MWPNIQGRDRVLKEDISRKKGEIRVYRHCSGGVQLLMACLVDMGMVSGGIR
jgi:hypothetical protein